MDKTFLELTIVGFTVALALLYLLRSYLISSGVFGAPKQNGCAFSAGCSGCRVGNAKVVLRGHSAVRDKRTSLPII